MSDKAREFAEAIIKTKPDTTTHDSPKKPRQKRRITSSVRETYKFRIAGSGNTVIR